MTASLLISGQTLEIRRASVDHHFSAGDVIQAIRVASWDTVGAYCMIELEGDSKHYYSRVPWVDIEVMRDDPQTAGSSFD